MMLGLGTDAAGNIDLTQDVAGNYFNTPTGLIPCSAVSLEEGFYQGPVPCDPGTGGVTYTLPSGKTIIGTGIGTGGTPADQINPASTPTTPWNFQTFWNQYGNYILLGTAAVFVMSMAGGSGGRRR